MVKKNILTTIGVILLCSNAFASEGAKQSAQNITQSQQIVDEYKLYSSKVSKEVRDEVIAYRKEISKINRQKREIYQKLSQEAQGYLAKEQEFKKKLPIKQKKLININTEEGNNKPKK